MDLDELQSIQSRERQASSLQNLRATFYQDAGEFIQELVRERDCAAERADDPFSSDEVRRLSDDIETAKSTVEAIYERRVGKVVKTASIAAAGMPADDAGLTEEEQELFETLVDRIERNRERVLDGVIENGGSGISCSRDPQETSAGSASADSAAVETTVDAEPGAAAELGLDTDAESELAPKSVPETDATGDETELVDHADESDVAAASSGEEPSDNGPAVERTTVRITSDIGEVFGVDERSYDLSAEDVVTLPAENAGPLVERDAAERLD
ncbi:hypothetical protein [Halosegnis sp.]|uniref:DNA replication complex subunit Gins51 n=1 Tax=Halosegnis sp. TaxID=2864959 RepID=UPI0035D3F0C6